MISTSSFSNFADRDGAVRTASRSSDDLCLFSSSSSGRPMAPLPPMRRTDGLFMAIRYVVEAFNGHVELGFKNDWH